MSVSREVPAVRLVDVVKRFTAPVFDGISLEIQPGTAMVVMALGERQDGAAQAHHGAFAAGRRAPGAGGSRLLVGQRARRERLRKQVGMVFQEGALFDSFTVLDNVAFPLLRRGDVPSARSSSAPGVPAVGSPGRTEGLRLPSCPRHAPARGVGARADARAQGAPLRRAHRGLDPILVTVIDDLILEVTRRLHVTSITATHDLRTARSSAIASPCSGELARRRRPARQFFELPNPTVGNSWRGARASGRGSGPGGPP